MIYLSKVNLVNNLILKCNRFSGIASYKLRSSSKKIVDWVGKYNSFNSYFGNERPNALDIIPTMPKVKNNSELRHLRIKLKNSKQDQPKPRPSEIYLSVLGNGAKGSPRALYMFTDQARYLFNCGEGTQRLAHEHKMKLSKLEHIFITHKSWENLGGLIGLSLTVQDIGLPDITLHGPPGIADLYSLTRSFALTKDLKIVTRHHDDTPFSDNCMEVCSFPIYSSSPSYGLSEPTSPMCTDSSSAESPEPEEQKCKRMKSMEEESLSEDDSKLQVIIAYACKGHSKPGQLVIEKCVELGVPPGPLLGELKSGKDIILPSGKVVRSQDVVSPEQPCPVFLVVECPSEEFLGPFVNEEKFKAYQMCATTSHDTAALVVHFTPPEIMQTEKYRSWMQRFPASTCHLVLNADNSTMNSIAIHRIQHKLHLVHPQIFGLLCEDESQVQNDFMKDQLPNLVQAGTLCRFYLRPHKGLDKTFGINVEPATYIEEATNMPGFHDNLEKLKSSVSDINITNHEQENPEVIFLGTGSSVPSKVRNVSGILVNTSSESSILLDCGEGTYNQIQRIYGIAAVQSELQKISCIFISHLHADHHLGLFQLLKERKIAFNLSERTYTPVTVIAPWMLNNWFINYNEEFEPVASLFRFIPCSALKYDIRCSSEQHQDWLKESCYDFGISTVPVKHCIEAYGVCLKSEDWKLVYSGDTVPCHTLVEAGNDCTLLIHEATMEDDLEDEAALKMHSTTSQAISIAEKMQAKFTILTHFSQRYAKVPVFSEHFQNDIGCAFDNMRVRRCDLPVVPLFIPTLKCLFAQEVEELLEKGVKRLKKMQSLSTSIDDLTS